MVIFHHLNSCVNFGGAATTQIACDITFSPLTSRSAVGTAPICVPRSKCLRRTICLQQIPRAKGSVRRWNNRYITGRQEGRKEGGKGRATGLPLITPLAATAEASLEVEGGEAKSLFQKATLSSPSPFETKNDAAWQQAIESL